MGKFQDLSGLKFGDWEVLRRDHGKRWSCRCSCGKVKSVLRDHLVDGTSTNCGCRKHCIHEGERYNRLTAIEYVGDGKWRCRCDCGKETVVRSTRLKSGETKSCGCILKDGIYGDSFNRKLYAMWKDMIYRCEKSNCQSYQNYGARGITVCKEWHDYTLFRKWAMGNGFDESKGRNCSIERKDVNGNYIPENCTFATISEQSNNKRTSRRIHAFGKTMTMTQWANETGISRDCIKHRLSAGWSEEDALTKSPMRRKNKTSEVNI